MLVSSDEIPLLNFTINVLITDIIASPGLACPTVLSAEVAALQSAQILGLTDHMIWSKIRARDLNCRFSRKQAEMYIRENWPYLGSRTIV